MTQEIIRSKDNKWLKAFRTALSGTGHEESQPLGIEGVKFVEDAFASGLEGQALLVSESGEAQLARILKAAADSQTGLPRGRIFKTTDRLFEGVTGTEKPQGIAALFRQPIWALENLLHGPANSNGSHAGAQPLIICMAGVQDPGNVGTILRSAEAFGATGVIALRGTADPWSAKSVRASAGSALRLPLLRGMAAPLILAQLRISEVKIVTASARIKTPTKGESKASFEECVRGPVAIFVGSEGAGLPAEVEHAADANISIAMNDAVESLNAGVAAAIVLYEAAKIRRG